MCISRDRADTPPEQLVSFHFVDQLTLLTFQLATSWSMMVVLIYWSVIFPTQAPKTPGAMFVNVCLHGAAYLVFFAGPCCRSILNDVLLLFIITGLGLVCMLIEFAMSRLTFVWRHLLWVIAHSVLYMIINMIYTLSTGIPLYSVVLNVSFVFHCTVFIIVYACASHFLSSGRF